MIRHLNRVRAERVAHLAEEGVSAAASVPAGSPPPALVLALAQAGRIASNAPAVRPAGTQPTTASPQSLSAPPAAIAHPGELIEDGTDEPQGVAPGVLGESEQATQVLRQFRQARSDFGLARIKLGAYLHLIQENKLWRGVAESFGAFIGAENINPNAARQYANVARQFIFKMDLPEETLQKLSLAGISALEKAGKFITPENQEEVIGVLTELSDRDAMQRIIEMSSGEEPVTEKPTLRVLKLLREFHELPPDLQAQFRSRIARPTQAGPASGANAASA